LNPSAVPQIAAPEPFIVNVPLLNVALPAVPTEPTSESFQPDGRPLVGAGVTVRSRPLLTVKLPEFPVMVRFTVPVVAVLLAVSVSVLELLVLAGLKLAVTPAGKPEADKFTTPLNPFCPLMLIVVVPLVP